MQRKQCRVRFIRLWTWHSSQRQKKSRLAVNRAEVGPSANAPKAANTGPTLSRAANGFKSDRLLVVSPREGISPVEQNLTRLPAWKPQIVVDGGPGLIGEFKPHWPTVLP